MRACLVRFRALPPQERLLLLQALLLLPVFAAGLRVLGLTRLRARLPRPSAPELAHRVEPGPARIGSLINSAGARLPRPASCLTRSLLLEWLLRRRGVPCELRIGVRMQRGRLDAHAWVECEGRPVNDVPDVAQRFAAFDGPLPARAFPAS